MQSRLVLLAILLPWLAIGCSSYVTPTASTTQTPGIPTDDHRVTETREAGVRLQEVSSEPPADLARAPDLGYSPETAPYFIHETDRGTLEGRMLIAVVASASRDETALRMRSVRYLDKTLGAIGILDVDIELDRAQPFDAIATEAPILLASDYPRGRHAERYGRELRQYIQGGGVIVGTVPAALRQQGYWELLSEDHPLMTTPYKIGPRRREDRTRALIVDGRIAAVSRGYELPASTPLRPSRLTGDEAKRWANLFAYVAGPRRSGTSLARTLTPEEADDTSIEPPRYLPALTSTPKRVPEAR